MFFKKIVRVPIYPFRIGLVLCRTYEEAHKRIKGFECQYEPEEEIYGVCIRGVCMEKKERMKCIYIALNPWHSQDNIIDSSIIAHECIHAKNIIFSEIGHTNTTTNDEPEAYLMQWLMKEVETFLRDSLDKLQRDAEKNNTEDLKINKGKILRGTSGNRKCLPTNQAHS